MHGVNKDVKNNVSSYMSHQLIVQYYMLHCKDMRKQ